MSDLLPLFMLTRVVSTGTANNNEVDDDGNDDYDNDDDDDPDDNDDDDDDECLFVRPGLLLQSVALSLFSSRFGPQAYNQAGYTKPWHRL